MIRLRQLTLRRGHRVVLQDANLVIAPGERLALIGPNGSGKSSLLAALAGELGADQGDIEQSPTLRIGRLEQSLPRSAEPAWRFVLAADSVLMQAEAALARALAAQDDAAIALAHDQLTQADAAAAPARARELLHGLGFGTARSELPVDQLSGGWRMRLNVARALMTPCDLLLLDEPTNHLDIDAIIWLERRIMRYPGTVIVVSHDRDFIDRAVQGTLHIDQGTLTRYTGGYSACEQARAARAAQTERLRTAKAQHRERLERFVARFRAQASKARQAQSRLKALERLDVLTPLRQSRGIDFEFAPVTDCPDPLIQLEQVDVGFAAQTDGATATRLIRAVDITLRPGTRLGILGRNGAGKTTLIRTLVGELPPLAGTVQRARGLRIGYFAQQQVDALRPDDSALAHMQRLAPSERDQSLRQWLARFAFQGEDATRPVGPMSGGERARLTLAMLVWTQPQLLILDEPTNHLDAPTRDALADALAEFDGALVLVSHDRYILRQTVDELMRIDEQGATPFDGDLDDYAQSLLKSPAPTDAPRSPPAPPRRDERRAAAERRAQQAARRKPLVHAVQQVESQLQTLQVRLGALDTELARPETYEDAPHATALARERATLLTEQGPLEERWLELSTELDALDNSQEIESPAPARSG